VSKAKAKDVSLQKNCGNNMISRVIIMHFLHLFGSVFKALLQRSNPQKEEKETNKSP
jgi:hypothetical protein